MPRALISDGGKHYNNASLENLLKKYGIRHRVTTLYHPQANDLVELANREVKGILEKMVFPNRKDWDFKLYEDLWAYRNAYKTYLGASPFRLVYGTTCHLPIDMEYKSYWASKMLNMDLNCAGANIHLDLG